MKYGPRQYMGATCLISVAKALPHDMRGDIVELSKLRTDPQFRRQGYAHELMLTVGVEADMARKVILLKVADGEIGGASKSDLVNFYMRHGFMPIQADPLLMARPHVAMRLNADA
jgi:predicted GNAT family N-acyltransferase